MNDLDKRTLDRWIERVDDDPVSECTGMFDCDCADCAADEYYLSALEADYVRRQPL
jgi:hypothetical protein